MTTEHGMLVLHRFKNRINMLAAFETVFDQIFDGNMSKLAIF